MSDTNIYELGDIIWDEFVRTDDHIVPHNEHASQIVNHKKFGFEVTGVSSKSEDKCTARCVIQEKQEKIISAEDVDINAMMEKDSWSHKCDDMFSGSKSDCVKEVTCLASDNTKVSSHCLTSNNIESLGEICSDYPILSSKCIAVDSNTYNYPSADISETESDPRFIDNAHEDKESGDLLYYSWPHIENFEDVDRMFRGGDPSFELVSTGNEDGTGWFVASDAIEGSDGASRSRFNFSCLDSNTSRKLSEELGPPKLKNENSSVNYSSIESESANYNANPQLSEFTDSASISRPSFVTSKIFEDKDKSIIENQGAEFSGVQLISTSNRLENDNRMIHFNRKQQKQKEGKRKNQHTEYGSSLCHIDDLQKKGINLPHGDTHHEVYSLNDVQKQQHLCYTSLDDLNNNIFDMQTNYHQPSDQYTVSAMLSGTQLENNAQPSLSQKESSHASNRVKPMQSSHDLTYEASHIVPEEMRRKLHHQQVFQFSSDSNSKIVDFTSTCNPASVQTGNKFENGSNMEGVSVGIPAELGSLNVQGNCSTNFGLNEASLEVTGFHQLQQVTEKLDLRTKLCIRDSLYRLARSAQQRHDYLTGGHGDDRDVRNFMTDGTNKCTGFMDMETNTNPIDRSIAHLLFHRPTNLPVTPCPNALFSESHSMKKESDTGPEAMVDDLLCDDESGVHANRKVAYQ